MLYFILSSDIRVVVMLGTFTVNFARDVIVSERSGKIQLPRTLEINENHLP